MATASTRSVVSQSDLRLASLRRAETPSSVVLLQMCLNFQELRQVHAQLIVSGLIHRHPNAGRLLESYVSASQTDAAWSLFQSIPSPDSFAFNTTIRGLILSKRANEAVWLFHKLLSDGAMPDNHTFTFILKACSHLKVLSEGQQVHCQIIKAGIIPNTYVHSSLVGMYSNANDMQSAERVLDELPEQQNLLAINALITGYLNQGQVDSARQIYGRMNRKDGSTWNILIAGYSKNGMHEEALLIFEEMMASQVPLSEATLVSSLSACAHLGNLNKGMYIHRYIGKNELKVGPKALTALVEMYAKCGLLHESFQVFKRIPQKDVVAWGAIISAFALHGQAEKCFELFDQMVSSGVSPNQIIFVSVLSACSHAGLVEMGYSYFDQMVHHFKIKPCIEHYGCMVDLLGRAGQIADAEQLILSMPQKPNAVIWGALLHACRIHKDSEAGKRAYKQLMEFDKVVGDRHKLAAQMFAEIGEVEDANEIRKFIRDKKFDKTCGMSYIEVDGVVHKFMVRDLNHDLSEKIYNLLTGPNEYSAR